MSGLRTARPDLPAPGLGSDRIAAAAGVSGARTDAGTTGETAEAWAAYVRAHRTYVPGPYDDRVTVLWPEEQPVANGNVRRDWSRVAAGVDIVGIRGTHDSALFRYLDDIVGVLKARFATDS